MEAAAADYSPTRISSETETRIAAELVRARESTVRLQLLLRSATGTDQHRLALTDDILSFITQAISILDSAAPKITSPDHSLSSDLDSGNTRRIPPFKDLERSTKKRRLANTRVVTSATTEDGYAWRKYGQKLILNTTHPRSYYRCTHKYEQSCGATKQVQRMEGDSIIYKITYISNHTCGPISPTPAPETTTTTTSASDSYNICFSTDESGNDRCVWPSDGDVEEKGETMSNVSDEIDLWLDLKDFGSLKETTMTNQYYFSMGDDANSSTMFWS